MAHSAGVCTNVGRTAAPTVRADECPRHGWRRVRVFVRFALALLVFGFAMWSAGGRAYACDPVTGVGCDTTPSPPSSPVTNPPPGTESPPQTRPPVGEPFIPPAPSTAPPQTTLPETTTEAPSTTQAPSTEAPSTTAATDTTSTSSGGGVGPLKLGLLAGGVLLAGGAGAAIVVARKNPNEDALTAFTNAAAAAREDQRVANQSIDALGVQFSALTSQLTAAEDTAAKRHAYIDNVARPALISSRNWTFWPAAGVGVSGGLLTGIPETIANASRIPDKRIAAAVVALLGATQVVVSGMAWYNAPSIDQIDQAISSLHASVDADLAKASTAIQAQIAQVNSASNTAAQAAQAAADRAKSFENLLQNAPSTPSTQ
jgi:hypothetical protein